MRMNSTKRSIAVIISLLFVLGTVLTAAGAPEVRVFVEYRPGQQETVRGELQKAGAEFHYQFDRLGMYVVTVPEKALTALQQNPNVVSIEPDPERWLVSTMPAVLADDSLLPEQVVPYGVDMVQARDIWDADRDGVVDKKAPTGAGRTVCIIDTGYYQAHEDLFGVSVDGYSQVDGEDTDRWIVDGYGHGTHVAGTITAMNNAYGVVGVTPGTVELFIVKIFDDAGEWVPKMRTSDLIGAAYLCAENGANVISMSLSGSSHSLPEENAFNDLYYNLGILSVAAASNGGKDLYHYPASYDSVVSVAAIDENKVVADFSQFNDQVELAAPGVGVLSTVSYLPNSFVIVGEESFTALGLEFAPLGEATGELVDGGRCLKTDPAADWTGKVVLCERGDATFLEKVQKVMANGGAAAVIYNNAPGIFSGTLGRTVKDCIVAVTISQEDGQYLVANKLGEAATVRNSLPIPGNGYEAWNGTSMSTPHVSAVAALIWSANPRWTNVQIREALAATALDLGEPGRDVYYGFGLVQAKAALDYLNPGMK